MSGRTQRELALLVTGKDVSASKTLKNVGREMGQLSKIAGKAGSNISRNIQRGVVLGAGAAAGAIGYAVNAAMDFESSSASVRKTVDGNVDGILAANRALAMHTGLEVNNLNEISATAGALGIAKADIDDFTKTVAVLGVTTDDVTTELGATSLGHLKTTLKLAGTDFEHLGNALVFLGNNGASTEGQVLAMTERIAGAAQVMDASTPQVLGWASALANAGVESELGGSAIQTFWTQSFANVAAGNAKFKLMAKISGQAAAAFKKNFGKDATGTLAKFIVKLGKLPKAAQLASLKELGLTGRQMTRVMLALTGNTDNLTQSLIDSEKGWKENDAATKEAAKRFETTASKVAILKANINDAAITIGQELLPVLADLSTDAVGWITAHRGDIHDFAITLSHGIRDAVTWAKSLDWNAIGDALKAGAGGAQLIIDAFMAAPPWLQQFLAVGFVANKFTGGALQDAFGALASGLIKGVLGMNAGVVHINAAVVNGGLGGGVAGAAKGGFPLLGGALGGGGPLLGRILQGAGGIGLLAGGNAVRTAGSDVGGPAGAALAAGGGAAQIGGAALLAGPLGAIIAAPLVAIATAIDQSNKNSELAAGVRQTADVFLQQNPTMAQLQSSLAAVDTGINEIQSNPLNVLVSGDALDQLKGTRAAIQTKIQAQIDSDRANADRLAHSAEVNGRQQTASSLAVRDSVESAKTKAAADASVQAAKIASARDAIEAAKIAQVSAINAKDLSVTANFHATIPVKVSLRETIQTRTTYIRIGNITKGLQ